MKTNLLCTIPSVKSLKTALKSFLIFTAFIGSTIVANAQNCSVNAGVDVTICSNETMQLIGNKTGAFPVGGGAILWSQIGGPSVTIVSPTSLTTNVTNFLGGYTYIFRITSTCEDGSLVFQDVKKTVNEITQANAGVDATYCPGTFNLAANAPVGPDEIGYWQGSGSNGITISNINSATSAVVISGGSSGTSTLTWTIENTVTGCSTSDMVSITNLGGMAVDAGVTPQTLSNCYSTTQTTNLAGSYAGSGLGGQQGTWSIITGPNVPTFSNIHASNSGISNLIEGTYTFRWTVVGPCSSGYDEVQIIVPAPTADVTGAGFVGGGNSQVFCDGRTSTVLNGVPPIYVNETVTWAQTNGPPLANIVSPNSPVTSVTGLNGSSTYTFSYTINNSTTGCSSSAGFTVSFASPPVINVEAGPVFLPCEVSVADISYTATGGSGTQYRILSGPPTVEDYGPPVVYVTYPTDWANTGSSPVRLVGLTGLGTYIVQFRQNASVGVECEAAFDEVAIITSFENSLSNAGTDQILNCNITATTLAGNEPDFGQGTWSLISGPGGVSTLGNIHDKDLDIFNLVPGLYTFRWLISGGPLCDPNWDDVTVLVASQTPTLHNAGPDQTVCNQAVVKMAATAPHFIFEQGVWSVVPANPSIVFADVHLNNTTVTGFTTAGSPYTLRWTMLNGCGSASDDVVITVDPTLSPIVANAGIDHCLASGTVKDTLNANNPSPYPGDWNFIDGPNTPFIVDQTLYNTEVTGMMNGTYRFEWVVDCGCICGVTKDTVLVTIDNPVTVADAGADITLCGNSTTMAANTAAVGTGLWTQIYGNGGAIITSPTSPTTTVTGLIDGAYKFRWTITNGACSTYDEVLVFVSNLVPSTADAGIDKGVCGDDFVAMTATAPTSGSGYWTQISGPNTAGISAPTSPTTNMTGLITGEYTFRWTVSGGPYCTPTFDDVVVTVVRLADAGSNQEYCQAITSVNLIGTVASSGIWTQVGSTPNVATITTTSANTATASGLITGVYTFQYAISAPTCSSTDQMTVTLRTPPNTANAGVDQELCDDATFTLDGNVANPGTQGTWTKLFGPTGETGSFNDVHNPDATYTPAGNKYGTYVFQWEIANGECSNADQVRIEHYQNPSTANAGGDQALVCDNEATMAANNPAVGLGTWTLVSKSPTAPAPTITSPILYNTIITGMGPQSPSGDPGVYEFKWTITNGPVCTPTQDNVIITVYQTPTPAVAGDDQLLCNQTTVTLDADPVTVGTGTWTQQSPVVTTEVITNVNLYNTTVTGLIPGQTYIFRWTTATAFCSSYDEVTITNYESPSTADASGTATSLCLYDVMELIGNNPAVGTGHWTQTAGDPLIIVDPNDYTTTVVGATLTGTSSESYTFRWTISNGTCPPDFDETTITLNQIPSQPQAGSDQELCNSTTTASLAAKRLLSASFTATNPSCFGFKGSVSVTGSGGFTPYTYRLDGGTAQASGTFTGIAGGNHTVVVEDQSSCTYTIEFKITVPTQLTISNSAQTNVNCRGASTGTVLVSAGGGTPPYTYSVPTQPAGGTFANVSGNQISNMEAGNYTIRVTDFEGCTANLNLTITQPATALSVSGSGTNPTCNGGSNGSISITASGGTSPYSYEWNNGSVAEDLSGLLAGSYTVTVTDDNGCTDSETFTLTNPAAVTITPSSITNTPCGSATGSVVLTSSDASTITVNGTTQNSGTTFSNLSAGKYVATSNGTCPASVSFTINNNNSTLAASASVTNPSCNGQTGSVTISVSGGVSTYSYLLDGLTSGGPSFSPLSSGLHSVLVTDSDVPPCTFIVYFTVEAAPALLTITLSSQSNVLCAGESTGRAVVKANGGKAPYTFSILSQPAFGTNASANGSVISIMEAGDYVISVQDANGCTANSATITITEPAAPLSITGAPITHPTCFGGNTGSIDITVSGGTGTYTYAWSNGAITQDPTSLIAGDYQVVITDENGCTVSGGPYTLTDPSAVTVTPSGVVTPSCPGIPGSVTLTSSDGSDITFKGITKASGSQWTNLLGGNYIATTQGTCPEVVDISVVNLIDGFWSVFSKPVAAPDPTFIDENDPATTVSGLVPGDSSLYVLTWTHTTGSPSCDKSDTLQIVVWANPTVANAGTDQTVCDETTFTLAANTPVHGEGTWTRVSGPNTPTITTPHSPTTTITGTTYGTYVYRWSILNGDICTPSSDLVTILNRNPVSTSGPADVTVCNGAQPTLTVTPSNGSGSYTYKWQQSDNNCSGTWSDIAPPATSQSYQTVALATGTYYYRAVVTDAEGICDPVDSRCVVVTVVADPAWLTNNVTPTTICEGGQVTFSATVSGGLGGTVSWIRSTTSGGAGTTVTSPHTENSAGTFYYRPHFEPSGLGCNLDDGTETVVTVVLDPSVSAPFGSTICSGATYSFPAVTISNGVSPTIQWEQSPNGTSGWVNVTGGSGATTTSYTTPVLTQTTWYRVQITDLISGCSDPVSAAAAVYVPRITTQPAAVDPEICVNGTSVLTVVTEVGSPAIAYTYQWQYDSDPGVGTSWANVSNGAPTGATYTNETTASMTVNLNSTPGNYDYRVLIQVVTPSCTELTSNTVTVTVEADPVINTAPVGGTICEGSTFPLSVSASVDLPFILSYQWQESDDNGVSDPWGNAVGGIGATTSSYTTPALTADRWYRVHITSTGSDCNQIYSTPVIVTVNNLTAGIIAEAQTICEGVTPAGLTSNTLATGDGDITYRWQVSTNGTDFSNISPAENGTTYSPGVLIVDTWYRRVAISTLNLVPCESNSNIIKITVNNLTPGVIAANQTMCSGSDAAAFTAPTAATGDGDLTYQWQISSIDTPYSWSNIGSATSPTYNEGVLTSDRWYQRITTSTLNTIPCSKISNVIRVTVNNIDPGSISGDQTICSGGDPTLLSSVTGYSGDGTLSYQWYYRDAASGAPPTGWTAIASTNTPDYNPPSGLLDDRWYSRLTTSVLNGVTCTSSTNLVRVTVNNVTAGTIQLAQTICEGGTPALLTTLSAANPDGGTLAYQWEISTVSGTTDFSDISPNGANETYQPLALTQDTWYRRRATSTLNGIPCSATTTAIKITVNNFTSANTIAAAQTICNNTTASLTGNAVTGDGTITYQWQSSLTEVGGYTNVSNGGTTQNYTTVALTADTWFQRVATTTLTVAPAAAKACTLISSPILVTVNNFTTAGTIELAQTICEGDIPAGLTSTALATSDGDITYRWQVSTNGTDFSNISPAENGTTYSPGALSVDTWYRRVAISTLNLVPCESNSNDIKITVNNLTAGTIATAQTICENTTADMTGTLPTADGTISYQWQSSSTQVGGYTNVSNGGTGQNYTTVALTADTWFQRVTISTLTVAPQAAKACSKISDPILVTVNNFTSANTIGTAQTICETNTADLTGNAVTADGIVTYQWQSSLTEVGGYSNVSNGGTGQNYTTVALSVDTWFQRIATSTQSVGGNPDKACTLTSVPVLVTVNNVTPGTIQLAQTICEGGTPALLTTLTAANPDGGSIAYQWEISTTSDVAGFSDISPDGTNETYQPLALTQDTWYRRRATSTLNTMPCSVTSVAIKITVNNFTDVNTIAGTQTICYQGTADLTGNAVTGDGTITYQWQSSLTEIGGYSNVSNGGTGQNYTTIGLTADTWFQRVATTTLTVAPAAAKACDLISSPVLVTIVPDPKIDTEPLSATICSGSATTLAVVASGGTPQLNYQWQISTIPNPYSWSDVSNGSGGNTNAYTTANLTQTTYYRVIVSATGNGCNPTDTSVVVAVHIPHITAQPMGADICRGGTHTMTVAAGSDGGTSTFSYQWQVSSIDCADGFANISVNATSSSYTTPVLNVDRYYRCIITSATPTCSMISECAPVMVLPDPTISVQPAGGTICSGSTFTLSVIAGNGTGSFTYEWQNSAALVGPYTNVTDGSGDGTDTYTTAALTASKYYRVIVSATGSGCSPVTSNPALVTVNQPSTANAGADAEICSNASHHLTGSATNYTSLLWTTSGTGAFNNPTTLTPIYTPSAADIIAGTVNLTLNAYSASPCATSNNDMTLTIYAVPTTANAGTDQITCGNSTSTSVNMAANTPTVGTGAWSLVTSTVGALVPNISIVASPTTSISNLGFGTASGDVVYTFRWTISNGTCTASTDDVDITLEQCCPVTFNENLTVCAASANNSVNVLNGEYSSGGFNLILNTTPVSGLLNGGTYTWVSGTTFNYTPAPAYTGTDRVIVQWCDDATPPCCINDTIFLTVSPAANAGTDQTLCNQTYATLVGNTISGASVSWSQVSGPSTAVIFLPNNSSAVAFNLVNTGTYVFQYSVTNGACSTSDQVTINIYDMPTVANAGADQLLCEETTFTMGGNTALSGTGTWSLMSGPNTPTITSPNSPTTTITGTITGTYVFRWTISNPSCSDSYDEVTITNSQPAYNVFAGADATICETGTFSLSTATASNYTSVQWSTCSNGCGIFSDPHILHPVFTPTNSDILNGFVILKLTAFSAEPCDTVMDQLTLTISKQAVVNAGIDITVCQGETYTCCCGISATNTTGILWTENGTGTLSNATTLYPTYTPGPGESGQVTLTLTGTSASPCSTDDDTMILTILPDVTIDAGSNLEICSTTATVALTGASAANATSYQWTTSGTGIITNPTSLTTASYAPSASDIATGQVQLTLFATGTCETVSDFRVLTIWPAPLSNAGPDATICSGNSYLLNNATASNYSQVTWSSTGGTFSNANALNPTFTPTTTGNITITLTATGFGICTDATSSLTLTVNPAVTLTASSIVNTQCNSSVGSVILTGSVAGTVTLNGVDKASPATYTGLEAGFYTATFVATATGCTATTTFNILNDNSTLAATVSVADPNCNGGTVTATVAATGGTAPYSYSLNGGTAQPTGVFNTLGAGDYNVLVTDNNGCTYYVAFDIDEPTALLAQITSSSNVSCYLAADGTATVNVSGGTTPYTYSWNTTPAQLTATATGLAPGNYTVTVTDAKSCTTTASVEITSPSAALAIVLTGSVNPTCNGDNNGSINITVTSGTSPYSYSWSNGFNGQDPSGLTAGSYTIIVTDANGCTATDSYTLTQPSTLTLTASGIVNTQCNSSVGSVILTGSVAGTVTLNGIDKASPATYIGLEAGFYTATFVATATGCTATTTFNILNDNSTLAATVSVADPNCNGGTVTATVAATGGTAPYSYSLNGGTAQPTGVFNTLGAGDYNVLVTDNNGCTYYVAFDIDEPTALLAQITSSSNVSCYLAADGTATVNVTGGTTPYSYSWNTTPVQLTATATGLAPGTYIVTVTDAKSCTTTASVEITQPAVLSASTTVNANVLCYGQATGSATVNPTGGTSPYTYLWENGSTDKTATGLSAGTYDVTVTDANGCTTASSATITQPAGPLAVNAGVDATICSTDIDYDLVGSATNYSTLLWTTSGTGTFGGETTLTATYTPGLADINVGQVQLTLTAYGLGNCEVIDFMVLSIWPGPSANAGTDVTICAGSTLLINSATASNYATITWSTNRNGTFDNVNSLTPVYTPGAQDIFFGDATLTLTATGGGLCSTVTNTMLLTIITAPTVSAGSDANLCITPLVTTYTLAGTATNYSTLLWTTSGTGAFNNTGILLPVYTPSTADIADGQVVLTLTANGNSPCSSIENSMVLSIWNAPVAYAGLSAEICNNETYQILDATAANYASFIWSEDGTGSLTNANTLTPTYTPSIGETGNVTVTLTVIAQNGSCSNTQSSMVITLRPPLSVSVGSDAEICVSTTPTFTRTATGSNYSTLLWVSSGSGTFSTTSALTTIYTPSEGDINDGQVQLTLHAYSNNACPDVSDVMTLTLWQSPTSNAGPDMTICSDGTYFISGSSASNFNTITWSTDGTGTFDNVNSLNPTYTPSIADITDASIILTLTATANGNCLDATNTMTLFITKAPTVSAGTDATMCSTDVTYSLNGTTANSASVLWTTSGSGVFNDATNIDPVYTPSAADISSGQVVLTVTALGNTSCDLVSDQMILSIWPGPSANAGTDETICAGSTLLINSATASNYATITWSTSRNGTFDNANSLTPVYTPGAQDISNGNATLTLTATGGGSCTTATNDMVLTITTAPTVSAGSDATMCSTDVTYSLNGTTANSASVLWTTSGSGVFNDATNIDPVYTPSAADISSGQVVLTVTALGNTSCDLVSDQMILSIWPGPTANAGTDETICAGSTLLINSATASNYTTITWSTNRNGTFDNANSLTPVYTPGSQDLFFGDATLTLTATGGGLCSTVTNTMLLTIITAPTVSAGSDANLCITPLVTTYTLAGTATNYSTLLWTTSGTGAFNNTGILLPVYTPSAADIADGQVVLTLTANGNSPCSSIENSMVLSIWNAPTAYAGLSAEICNNETYQILDATAANYASFIWSENGTGSLTNANTLTPTYTPSIGETGNVTVTLTVIAQNGSCSNTQSSMVITLRPPLSVSVGADAEICVSTTPTFTRIATGSNYSTLLWVTSGSGTFSTTTALTTIYTPSEGDITDGQVQLTLNAYSNNACPDVSDVMTLTLWQSATAFAGNDHTVCANTSFTIQDAHATNYASVLWTENGTGTLSGETTLAPTYTPGTDEVAVVTLTLTATPVGSCPVTTDVLTLNYLVAPEVDANADVVICSTEGSYTLDGSSNGTVLWTTSGTGTFDDATDLGAIYTPSQEDIEDAQIQLTLTTTIIGDCPNISDFMVLSIWKPARVAAGPDATICEGKTFGLCCSTASDYTSLLWTTDGNGTFDNPTALHPVYTPSLADVTDGSIILTLNAYSEDPCTDASDSRTLFIISQVTADAGPDQFVDGQASVNMGSNDPRPGSGYWTQISGPTIANIVDPTEPDTEINGLVSGTYTFRWTITNLPCAADWDEVQIINSPQADIAVDKTATPSPTAPGENITYTIKVTNNGPDDAQNVSLQDILPPNIVFVSANSSTGTWTAPNWTIGPLAVGAIETITIVATVDCDFSCIINNVATVSSSTADPNPGNNTDNAEVVVQVPPVANDNSSSGHIPGQNAVLNILTNDLLGDKTTTPAPADVIVDLDPVTPGVQQVLTVAGEGVWTYNPTTGELTFNPDAGFLDDPSPITYTITEISTGLTSNIANVTVTYICYSINVKAFLQGAFNPLTGLMSTQINNFGILPGEKPLPSVTPTPAGQPYNIAPWNYNDVSGTNYGDLSVNPSATKPYPANVVDWVLVSVRQGDSLASSEIFRCVGLIYKNGQIELECPCFRTAGVDKYYILVEHRNHLMVMSKVSKMNGGTVLGYDFTTADSWRLGTPIPQEVGQKKIGSFWVMFGGNGDQQYNGSSQFDVNSLDYHIWSSDNGKVFQYIDGDYDLNLDANSLDDDLWINNNGKINFIPR